MSLVLAANEKDAKIYGAPQYMTISSQICLLKPAREKSYISGYFE